MICTRYYRCRYCANILCADVAGALASPKSAPRADDCIYWTEFDILKPPTLLWSLILNIALLRHTIHNIPFHYSQVGDVEFEGCTSTEERTSAVYGGVFLRPSNGVLYYSLFTNF